MSRVEAVFASDAEKAGAADTGHQPDAVPLPGRTRRGQGIPAHTPTTATFC